MGMTIATNNAALNAYRNLNNTQNKLNSSLQKLSSGFRINNAADDAAGLSISEGLQSQISGIAQAGRNAQDGISVIQTADGALSEVTSILHRMRDLAVQGANDSNSTSSRAAIKTEADDLGKELDRIATNTNFNGINLLQGGSLNFQVGAGSTADNTIAVNLTDLSTAAGTLSGATGATGFDVTDERDRQHHDRRDRHRHRRCLHLACRPRRLDQPFPVGSEQPQHRGPEPDRCELADQGHRHGGRDGQLHPVQHPRPGRYRHARAGEPVGPGHPQAAPVVGANAERLAVTGRRTGPRLPQSAGRFRVSPRSPGQRRHPRTTSTKAVRQ